MRMHKTVKKCKIGGGTHIQWKRKKYTELTYNHCRVIGVNTHGTGREEGGHSDGKTSERLHVGGS